MSVTIRVFDPAMCCSTGVCGPSVDPELARFAADLDWLKKQGVTVERFNLSQQPAAFADDAGREGGARGAGNEVPAARARGRPDRSRGRLPVARDAGRAGRRRRRSKLEAAPASVELLRPERERPKSKTGCC